MARNSKSSREYDQNDRKFQKKKGKGKGKSKDFRQDSKSSSANRNTTSSNLPPHDTSADNDIKYWNGAGQLYVDATTIPTYSALGTKHVSPFYRKPYYSPTGIARFDYVPFFGDINSSIHPINTTAKIMYNAINSKNSRMPSYDPSDLMIYVIAVAQAWSIHAWVRRLCGMFNTFSVVNRYWWEPICTSMGVSPISTDNDIVTWRNLANHMALILDRLPVPDGIQYFERTAWMNMNIYMDSPVGKSTYYYFSPASVFKYDYDADKVGKLSMVETPWHKGVTGGQLITPKMVETFFMDLIVNLFNDSDIPVIGADILKAFDGKIYSIGQIDSSFVLGPVYSPEVNLELHNARLNYGGTTLYDRTSSENPRPYDLIQDMTTNTIRSTQVIWDMPAELSTSFMATDMLGSRGIAVDFPIDNPSNDDWMIATRLAWAATTPPEGQETNYAVLTCGTEMLINDAFYEFTQIGDKWELNKEDRCCLGTASGTVATLLTLMKKFGRATKLHDAPIIFFIKPASSSAQFKEPNEMEILSDLTNYCTISYENLANMNDVAQISVFLPEWLRNTIIGK